LKIFLVQVFLKESDSVGIKVFMLPALNLFRNPDYYNDEVPEFFKQDRTLNLIAIIFLSALFLLHFFSDYKFFGISFKLYLLAAIRLAYILFSAVIIFILYRIKTYFYYSLTYFLWCVITLTFIFFIDSTRPKTYITGISTNMLLMMSFFIVVRLRLLLQIIIAALASFYILFQLYYIKEVYATQTYFSFIINIVIIFIMGIIFSIQIKKYRLRILKNKIHEKELSTELLALANTDPLTGIFNRRKIYDTLEKEIERKKRYGMPVSLIIFDIDYLKRVNDTHGHDTGDLMIAKISSILKKELRITDHIGRVGGDEFLIVLPNSAIKDAIILAERIKSVLNATVIHADAEDIGLSGSMGLTEIKDGDATMEAPLKRADINLYQMKRKGRNGFIY